MTLDDLVKTFDAGFQAKLMSEDYPREAFGTPTLNLAGIRAVVLALRDEFDSIMWGDDEWNNEGIVGHFNDILGDAGNEKAAGGPTSNAGDLTCGFTAPAADLTVGQRLINAAHEAAAIARGEVATSSPQCEWRDEGNIWLTDCGKWNYGWSSKLGKIVCPSCGLPIKFKEPSQ